MDKNPTGEVAEEAGGEGRKLGGEDSIGLGLHGVDLSHRERDRSDGCKFLQNPLEAWKILLRRTLFCLDVFDLHKERKRLKETKNL